jgi:transcriptional regulator with XRE-family HTH domain
MSHEAVDFGDCTACNAYDRVIWDTRKKLRCSRAVFARKLRINERTLEKWEQGRAKPKPQAAALVLLVRRYPDTLARLDEVAEGVESAIPMK